MKRFILLSLVLIILGNDFLFAQEGRPQYNIRNERAGEYIGDIVIELFPHVAPLHVANFDSLVAISFYDSTAWHRVVPNFVIQGGDPNSINGPRDTWGEGDSTQTTVPAEFSKVSHLYGIIGAARGTDINSATSQFYVNTANNTGLDGNYTAYGVVVQGMDVVEDIESSPRDGNDNPFDKIEMFITKLGVNESFPDAPMMVEPENDFQGFQKSSNITWADAEDAVLTFLEIAEDSNFTQVVFADSFGVTVNGETSVKYPDVELGRNTYYWRVRSNNGAKFSEFSEVRSFTTSIFSPELLLPPNNAEDISVTPTLEWETADGAVSYRVQITKGFPSFVESRIVLDQAGIEGTELLVENLEPNTRYYWHVLSEAQTYESPYSQTWLFTTEDPTGVEDETIPFEYSLEQNYPNPFNPATLIKFNIPKTSKVDLKIYDLTGREVKTLFNGLTSPGSYEVQFNAAELSSGIYYYRLIAGDYSEVRKMILIK